MADIANTRMAGGSFESFTRSEVLDNQPTYRDGARMSAMPITVNRPHTSSWAGDVENYVVVRDPSRSATAIPTARDEASSDEELIEMLCVARHELIVSATSSLPTQVSGSSGSGYAMAPLAQPDARPLELLYDRYSRRCYALAVRILNSPAEAEEVVQEVFLKLWQMPQSFNPQRGRFASWLLSVVHHRCIDELRRNKRVVSGNISFDVEGGDDLLSRQPSRQKGPEEVTWESFQRTALRRALTRLSEAQRRVIELGYFGGMTQREMADILCEPLGTIKTRVRLAMQKLRLMLEAEGWENQF